MQSALYIVSRSVVMYRSCYDHRISHDMKFFIAVGDTKGFTKSMSGASVCKIYRLFVIKIPEIF